MKKTQEYSSGEGDVPNFFLYALNRKQIDEPRSAARIEKTATSTDSRRADRNARSPQGIMGGRRDREHVPSLVGAGAGPCAAAAGMKMATTSAATATAPSGALGAAIPPPDTSAGAERKRGPHGHHATHRHRPRTQTPLSLSLLPPLCFSSEKA